METTVEVDAGHEIEAVERLFLRFGDKFPNRFPILLKLLEFAAVPSVVGPSAADMRCYGKTFDVDDAIA